MFKPVFINLNLPFSIIRKEITPIHLTVFNYEKRAIDGYFLVESPDNDLLIDNCSNIFQVNSNDVGFFTCKVKSLRSGRFNVTVKLFDKCTDDLIDGETRELLVKYEGRNEIGRSSELLELMDDQEIKELVKQIPIDFPEDRVLGSEYLFISATSDLLIVVWEEKTNKIINLNKDVIFNFEKVEACCEQRIRWNYPKLFWLRFKTASGNFNNEDYALAMQHLHWLIENLCYPDPFDGWFPPYCNN